MKEALAGAWLATHMTYGTKKGTSEGVAHTIVKDEFATAFRH